MPDPALRVLTEQERELTRQWLENWRIAGPMLEAERTARLATLTPHEAALASLDLWRFARPGGGDDAEGLRVLKKIVRSPRSSQP